MEPYEELCALVKKGMIVGSIQEVLGWDRDVMMPKGASEHRAVQEGTLAAVTHQLLVNPRIGALLAIVEPQNDEQRRNVAEIKRRYERNVRVPEYVVQEFSHICSTAHHAWEQARKASDFSVFAPHLQKIVTLLRTIAQHIDPNKDPYQVLFEEYEPSMTIEQVNTYFADIRSALLPLIQAATSHTTYDFLHKDIDIGVQQHVNHELLRAIGYDFVKGRLDVSTHPFTACYGRITTRFSEGWVSALGSTMHEAGHAFYEHGLPEQWFGLPLGEAVSLSVHESQSRFWENHIWRSRAFWQFFLPKVQEAYGLSVDVDTLYTAINQVQPSFIRVEADELTYPFHIMLRFTIEQELIRGTLAVENVPQRWNALMKEYLGVDVPNDAQGCLQDVHWSMGSMGYFATYAIGTMLSAQLHACMQKSIDVDTCVVQGNFEPLKEWLHTHIWSQGNLYDTLTLAQKVTGKPLGAQDYIAYLQDKYQR
ncbi:MAG: carboxypeptidase M32 [Candidatus Woesearchaeota archaeon]